MVLDYKQIGKNLARRRKELKLKQTEVCERAEINDKYLSCIETACSIPSLEALRLQYLTVEHQPLRLRDKLYVTYTNGSTGVFYNRDAILTVACIDGSYKKIALNRIRHIVF